MTSVYRNRNRTARDTHANRQSKETTEVNSKKDVRRTEL